VKRLVRARVRSSLIFGTSQLNIGNPTSPGCGAAHDLDGVRFVDMPWLLQPDHPAVMVYPQPAQPMPTELARLYAFGIDAYRIAQAWMNGESRFDRWRDRAPDYRPIARGTRRTSSFVGDLSQRHDRARGGRALMSTSGRPRAGTVRTLKQRAGTAQRMPPRGISPQRVVS
jgi:hypothetical protein